MIAYITFPTTAIDISTGTTFDVGISRSGETSSIVGSIGTHTKEIVYRTSGTGSIDVFLNRTAKQGYIGGAINVTAKSQVFISQSATVGIAYHGGAVVNADVGVVFFESLGLFLIRIPCIVTVIHICVMGDERCIGEVRPTVGDVCVEIYRGFIIISQSPGISPICSPAGFQFFSIRNVHTVCQRPFTGVFPIRVICCNLIRWTILIQLHVFLYTLGIKHMTHLATAINLIDLGTILQVHLGVFRPRVDTFSCAIDGG